MGKVKMSKLTVVSHTKYREKLFSVLQHLRAVHLEEVSKTPPIVDEEKLSELNHSLTQLKYAISSLLKFKKKKRSPIETFVELDHRMPISKSRREEVAKSFIGNINNFSSEIKKGENKLAELNSEIAQIEEKKESMQKFLFLDVPLSKIGETSQTNILLVRIKDAELKKIAKHSEHIAFEIMQKGPSLTVILVVAKGFEKELKKYKYEPINLPKVEFDGTPAEIIKELERKRVKLIEEKEQTTESLKEFLKQLEKAQITYDYLMSEKKKLEATKKLLFTKQTFTLAGWVPTNRVDEVKRAAEKATDKVCYIKVEEASPKEHPPILLKNNWLSKPFEIVTTTFGLPNYFESDPTPYLAPFFFVFTGLCLTEAGYGIVLAIGALILGWKIKQMRSFAFLLFLIGVSTTIAGALIGSWFGGLIPLKPIWFDSFKYPLTFLILSLVIGIVHLVWGLLVKFYEEMKAGRIFSAFADSITWAVLLLSISGIIAGSNGVLSSSATKILTYVAGGDVLILILTQGRFEKSIFKKLITGVLSLYGLIGYLSDVLSYSRLLALGMATGVVALIVDELAKLSMSIPIIGIVAAIGVLIIGHLFNLIISTLGAYIHSSRLQYVEFFSKFFEGGGKYFKPFSSADVYTKEVQ